MLKPLVIAGAMLFAASAFAQPQNQKGDLPRPQAPAGGQTNAQGEQPNAGRTMQEKDTGLMNQSGGAPGATGSAGTQSGTTPNTGTAGQAK